MLDKGHKVYLIFNHSSWELSPFPFYYIKLLQKPNLIYSPGLKRPLLKAWICFLKLNKQMAKSGKQKRHDQIRCRVKYLFPSLPSVTERFLKYLQKTCSVASCNLSQATGEERGQMAGVRGQGQEWEDTMTESTKTKFSFSFCFLHINNNLNSW